MKTALLVIMQLAASGSDAYFNRRNLGTRDWRERDPIARPFVQSDKGIVIYFSATAGLKITAAHLLKKHHHKLSDFASVYGIIDNSEGAIFSATH
jgi:hypothetical protein